MSLILNIDTSTENATVSVAQDGTIIQSAENNNQKEHATFLHETIKILLASTSISMNSIDAIAVTEGPGSYTGLRVGMSTAKGLCYALQKPLIAICTLKMMAKDSSISNANDADLFCPMIDARRMEVFTAVFTNNLESVLEPCAMILDEHSFSKILFESKIAFSGNGCFKFKPVVTSQNALFLPNSNYTKALALLSFEYHQQGIFSDLALTEPKYIKEYIT
jgi:tRNA threonylcarbamoyladenosine biosynthesis protein TsaB